MSEDDLEVFMLFMTRLMAVFDTVVEHYEHGAIPAERFENYRKFIVQFLESEGGKKWITRNQYNFSAGTKLHVADSL